MQPPHWSRGCICLLRIGRSVARERFTQSGKPDDEEDGPDTDENLGESDETNRGAPLSKGPTLTCKYFDEPRLSFASGGQHIDPKIGIARFGPKSLNAPERHPSRVRVGLIGTAATIEDAREWIEVNAKGVPGDGEHPAIPGCLPDRGFHTTLEFSDAWAEQITRSEMDDLLGIRARKDRFNKALVLLDEKLAVLSRKDLTPEYIILALPDNLRDKCGVLDYFDQRLGRVHRDLRRAFKANAMKYRLPTQLVDPMTTEFRDSDNPTKIAWNFFTGLYFKSGGMPWGPYRAHTWKLLRRHKLLSGPSIQQRVRGVVGGERDGSPLSAGTGAGVPPLEGQLPAPAQGQPGFDGAPPRGETSGRRHSGCGAGPDRTLDPPMPFIYDSSVKAEAKPETGRASRAAGASRLKLDLQAVILAGGLGTRMRPLTETIPKAMIEVCGKPFLGHLLELVRENGMARVLLLVAHLGQKIEEYFGDGSRLGLQLSYSYEPAPLGTGGALKHAADKLEGEFLVLNGDTFLPIDYAEMVRDFREHRPSASIVAYDNRAARTVSNLAVAADGRVTAYRKRDPLGLTHVDAGAILLRREVLDGIPPGRVCSLEEEVFPWLIEQGRMQAWVTREPFYDMGTPAGLEALARRLG